MVEHVSLGLAAAMCTGVGVRFLMCRFMFLFGEKQHVTAKMVCSIAMSACVHVARECRLLGYPTAFPGTTRYIVYSVYFLCHCMGSLRSVLIAEGLLNGFHLKP